MPDNKNRSGYESATNQENAHIWFDTSSQESADELSRLKAKSWETTAREGVDSSGTGNIHLGDNTEKEFINTNNFLGDGVTEDGLLSAQGTLIITGPNPKGNSFKSSIVSGKYGSLSIEKDGTWTYTLDNELQDVQTLNVRNSLADTIEVTSLDGTTHSLEIQVHGANDAPLLKIVSQATVDEDGTKTIAFKASDIEGEATTEALANNGDIVTDQEGTITYTPKADFSGKDTITVTTTDDSGATVVKTVEVTVNEINDLPTLEVTQTATVDEDGTKTIAFKASDIEGEVTTEALANNGDIVTDQDGTITYTPSADFNGKDTITVTTTDDSGATVVKTVEVTVNEINDLPTLEVTQTATVDEDGTKTIAFKANDIEGNVTTEALANNGDIVTDQEGTITYTPKADFSGKDTITVTTTDDSGAIVVKTVEVTVNEINDLPTLEVTQTATVDEDGTKTIAFKASDIEGNVTTEALANNGDIVTDQDGTITYTPSADFNGKDTITVTTTDDSGATVVKTVEVTVSEVNDLPTLEITQTATVNEDGTKTISFKASDIEGEVTTEALANNGDIVTDQDGTITYTPSADFNGKDTITVTTTDDSGATVVKTVEVTVSEVNDLPTLEITQTATVNEDGTKTISFKASDIEGEVTTEALANNGDIATDQDGTITYTPKADFSGKDTITVTTTDDSGATVVKNVKVSVSEIIDIIEGTIGNDRLTGTVGQDIFIGKDGNDTIYAGGDQQADQVKGDAGNDYIYAGGKDIVDGGEGVDTLDARHASYSDDGAGLNTDNITNVENIYGTNYDDSLKGEETNNILYGYDGDDSIDGGAGDDRLAGGEGNDSIAGGEGNDTIYAGGDQQADQVKGDAGNDYIYAGGKDIVDGGEGVDTLDARHASYSDDGAGLNTDNITNVENIYGTNYDDSLKGEETNNVLYGYDGDDSIDGGAGNDRLAGGEGNDSIAGGEGNDTIYAGGDQQADQVKGDAGNDYIYAGGKDIVDGGEGVDTLDARHASYSDDGAGLNTDNITNVENIYGTNYDDSLKGEETNNVLYGYDGDDSIDGGAGNDRLAGGEGNDSIAGGEGNDTIYAGGDQQADQVKGDAGNDYIYAGGKDIVDGGEGVDTLDARHASYSDDGAGLNTDNITNVENIYGTNYDDSLKGEETNNVLYGYDGDDSIDGGAGDDRLAGGEGNDSIAGGEGNDTIYAGGDQQADQVKGDAGNDYIYAGGKDIVDGGEGVDTLDARHASYSDDGAGLNTDNITNVENIYGTNYDDSLKGEETNNVLYGYDGDDSIDGGAGNDRLAGGEGNDSIAGGEGNDTIYAGGDQQADQVKGDAGNDYIYAGGKDIVDGGEGVDTLDARHASYSDDGAGLNTDNITNVENIYGTNYDDSLKGEETDNVLYGYDGDDSIDGGAGDDRLAGGEGNDSIAGGEGNDTIDGNDGNDNVIFTGNSNEYTFKKSGESLIVTDTHEQRDGIDTIKNIETIRFNDGEVSVQDLTDNIDDYNTLTEESLVNPFNTIIGTERSERLTGTDEADAIYGLAGNDTINGGLDDDLIYGGAGSDVLYGDEGNDTFIITADNNGAANDYDGGEGTDTIKATDGEDIIINGHLTQADSIEHIQGQGNTVIAGDASSQTIDLTNSTLTGINHIDGGQGNDTIIGSNLDDTIIGGAGSDNLYGGKGDDTFIIDSSNSGAANDYDGGEGTDTIKATDGEDIIINGHLTQADSIEHIQGQGNTVIAGDASSQTIDLTNSTLTGIDHIDGGQGNDTIIGSNLDDTIIGGAGSDNLYGGKGDDTFIIDSSNNGAANDYDGGEGTDTIKATDGEDIIINGHLTQADSIEHIQGQGNTVIAGDASSQTIDLTNSTLTGIDHIDGGQGNDTIIGSNLDDTIIGGAGSDNLYGGKGDDTFIIDSSNSGAANDYDGGEGTDTIKATDGEDIIIDGHLTQADSIEHIQGQGNTVIAGDASSQTIDLTNSTLTGIDHIDGGQGNDTIIGSNLDDTIIGGAGSDNLYGGKGDDTFIIDSSNNGAANDYDGGEGTDTIKATDGEDIIINGHLTQADSIEHIQGQGNTVIAGDASSQTIDLTNSTLTGIDHIDGGQGNDTIIGSNLDDTIIGGAGSDNLYGGKGDDTFIIDSSNNGAANDYDGGEGTDTIKATDGEDIIINGHLTQADSIEHIQGQGNTVIAGDASSQTIDLTNSTLTGIDHIDGGQGNDTIIGSNLDDTIIGGAGNDNVYGGAGEDIAVFSNESSSYSLRKNNNGSLTVKDTSEEDGTDTVQDVETLRFTDIDINVQEFINDPTSAGFSFDSASGTYTYSGTESNSTPLLTVSLGVGKVTTTSSQPIYLNLDSPNIYSFADKNSLEDNSGKLTLSNSNEDVNLTYNNGRGLGVTTEGEKGNDAKMIDGNEAIAIDFEQDVQSAEVVLKHLKGETTTWNAYDSDGQIVDSGTIEGPNNDSSFTVDIATESNFQYLAIQGNTGSKANGFNIQQVNCTPPANTEYELNIESSLFESNNNGEATIKITELPKGGELSGGVENNDGTWSLTQEQVQELTLSVPGSEPDNFEISVSTTFSDESGNPVTAEVSVASSDNSLEAKTVDIKLPTVNATTETRSNEPSQGTTDVESSQSLIGDASDFVITSNEQSFEEIPAMDEQGADMQEEQSIEAQDIGLGGDDAAVIEDLQDSMTIQEEVPAI